jgi:hypothetical protein
MTTNLDHGAEPEPVMLRCELQPSNVYPTLTLALRDLRQANGRDPVTGAGIGNESWIGLSLGMIVLDTLTGSTERGVGRRWGRLLTSHGISDEDAVIIYKMHNSLLHGYGIPKPSDTGGRTVLLIPDPSTYALDTTQDGWALLSVPVFCGRLVERIAAETPSTWDTSLINTDYRI